MGTAGTVCGIPLAIVTTGGGALIAVDVWGIDVTVVTGAVVAVVITGVVTAVVAVGITFAGIVGITFGINGGG